MENNQNNNLENNLINTQIQSPDNLNQQNLQNNLAPSSYNQPNPNKTSSGTIVLEWLTYLFWGWTVLAVSILTSLLLGYYLNNSDFGSYTPYGIAAVLVLFPIALTCEYFYSKQEPIKKVGAASVVMIIHAVIFAVLAVSALITAVFSLVTSFTSSSSGNSNKLLLYESLIVFLLYLFTLVRTINPAKIPKIRRIFVIFITLSIGTIIILSIIGPTINAHKTKNDTLITDNIGYIAQQIDSFAYSNNGLPNNLNGINASGDEKIIINNNSLSYQANIAPSKNNNTDITGYTSPIYYYQLCANYSSRANTSNQNSTPTNGYYDSTDFYIYNHPAGKTCYNLETSGY